MFNPPHPGGLVTEYLEDFDVSLRSLARDLGVTPSSLSKIATGKSAISPEMAVRFEAGLGISARLWLAMQAAYDLSKARETTDISNVIPSPYSAEVAAHERH
jgi:addiction module HigA family antidote